MQPLRTWPHEEISAFLRHGREDAGDLFQKLRGLLRNASPEELQAWSRHAAEGWAFLLIVAERRRLLRNQVLPCIRILASCKEWARAVSDRSDLRTRLRSLPKEFDEAFTSAAPPQRRGLAARFRLSVDESAGRRDPDTQTRQKTYEKKQRDTWQSGVPTDVRLELSEFQEPSAPLRARVSGEDAQLDDARERRLQLKRAEVEQEFRKAVAGVVSVRGPRASEAAPGSLFVLLRRAALHIRGVQAVGALENERGHAAVVVAFLVEVAVREPVKRRQALEVMKILETHPAWARALRQARRMLSLEDLDKLPDDFIELLSHPSGPSDDSLFSCRCWGSFTGDPALAIAPVIALLLIMISIFILWRDFPHVGIMGFESPSLVILVSLAWMIPPCLDIVSLWLSHRLQVVVRVKRPSFEDLETERNSQTWNEDDSARPRRVLIASLEHEVVHNGGKLKVVAGGLGKVMGMMPMYHPCSFVSVHACMEGKDYSFAETLAPIRATVDGRSVECKVMRYRVWKRNDGHAHEFYFVDHAIFRCRPGGDIYPVPMTARASLIFYALWSQAVALLIERLRPTVFHCPDFHCAMAVMYLQNPVPVVVTLHNAEYQGMISTQQMRANEIRQLSCIFNLPEHMIRAEAVSSGAFNMLKPVIKYVRRYQQGYGVCAVSKNYALEAAQKHAVLWGLAKVVGIENCMPESSRPRHGAPAGRESCPRGAEKLEENAAAFRERRSAAKRATQKALGLAVDPDARICVFLGRWVKQKGIDYIADVAPRVLEKHPRLQLVVIGPVGDAFGSYARVRLEALVAQRRFSRQLYVCAAFREVSEELKLACDFCLMPSRDEPFGYVDIEFAWYGAVIVGALRGGLGKLPGFYFQVFNSDSAAHMQAGLKAALATAMECDSPTFDEMSEAGRRSAFPVNDWQYELLALYATAMRKFGKVSRITRIIEALRSLTRSAKQSASRGQQGHALEAVSLESASGTEFLVQESLEEDIQRKVEERLARTLPRQPGGGSRLQRCCRRRAPTAPEILGEVERELHSAREAAAAVGGPSSAQGAVTVGGTRFRRAVAAWQLLLSSPLCGALVLDWLLSATYASGPLAFAVFLGLRSSDDSDTQLFEPAFAALFLLVWTAASRIVAPHKLMILALAARPLVFFFGGNAAVQGFVLSGDVVFVYFNFMGSAVGDIAKLSARTGLIMAARQASELLRPTVASAMLSNSSLVGIGIVCLWAFCILPILALLRVPAAYRDFRLPSFDMRWMTRLRFLPMLGLARVLHELQHASFAGALQLWSEHSELQSPYSVVIVVQFFSCAVCGVGAVCFPTYTIMLVRSLACFSAPAVLLQCWALRECVNRPELTWLLDWVFLYSSALDALSSFATGAGIAATVGTRWRFISYMCVVGAMGNVARIFSSFHAIPHGASVPPEQLSNALFAAAFALSCAEVSLLIVASAFLKREATGQLWTWRQRRLVRRAVKSDEPSISAELRTDGPDNAGFFSRFGLNLGRGWGWGAETRS